jgi:putative endonuclease
MPCVYLLRGTSGRHYLGSTVNLEERLQQHNRGHTATTLRLGLPVTLVASRSFPSLADARLAERILKRKKNIEVILFYLNSNQPIF